MVTKPAKPTEASIAIARIETLLAERDCVFVAIDGPCTSGKTTFAAMLNRRFGGNVLHMDDFFLRPEQRTPERFAEPGGNVDRERFETEVLAPLAAGQAAQYRPWDCHTGDFAVAYAVEPAQLTIVEGSYSMHPALRGYYDCMICLAVDPAEQLRRLERRNPRMLQRFVDEWIPLENRYFEATNIQAVADLLVDTALPDGGSVGTAPEHVTELVDLYKYGIRENRWSAMMDKLRDDPAAALRRTDLPKLSLGTKTAATLLAIVAAVVLPQLFHVIGAVSGQGTMLGVAFLPMHLPIIFVGLIAGPAVGAIAGAAAPLVSFLLSGMPMLVMLPLMMVELCAYGLVAGLLRGIKLPSLAKVVIAQLAGRVVLTAATAIAVFAFGSSKAIAATWTSDLAAGLPGLALQWALIPLAAYWTESLIAKRNH